MTTGSTNSIEVNGVRLAYTDTGAGDPAIVFVHGWTCDHTHWRPQVPAFEKSHRVLALDQRGHGASEKPDQDYTIAGFAADLAKFIESLSLDRPVVVGHSMGGVITLRLAFDRPDLMRAAVLVDAVVTPLPAALLPARDATIAALKSPAYKAAARQFSTQFMFREDSDPALKEMLLDGMGEAPQRLMWSAIESLLDETNLPSGTIPVPALFVRAAMHVASADEIRARYPGIEVAEVDCAHFVQLERPAEFNAILSQFLEGLA